MYNTTHNAAETQAILVKGVNLVEEAVGSTMGPAGHPYLIQGSRGHGTLITKDGVSVAKSISFADPAKQLGVTLITEAAMRANSRGGDGTTTCTVLSAALINALFDCDEITRIKLAPLIRNWITGLPERISPYVAQCQELEMLRAVTTISANGDKSLGNMIAEAIHITKGKAKINVVDNGSLEDALERVEEVQIAVRCTSLESSLDNALNSELVLCAGSFTAKHVDLFRRQRGTTAAPKRIIICEKTDQGIQRQLRTLASQGVYVCVLPDTAAVKQYHLTDLAEVLNCDILPADEFTSYTPTILTGSVSLRSNRIRLSLDGKAKVRAANLVETLEAITASENYTGRLRKLTDHRLDVWSPNYFELSIAAVSNLERKERFDRAEDSINACRNAYNHGVLPGGGTIGLYLALNVVNDDTLSQELKSVLERMLVAPFYRICKNAGITESEISNRTNNFEVLVSEESEEEHPTIYSYDLFSNVFDEYDEQMVLDPVEVFLSAMDAAVSIGLVVATTGGSIIVDGNTPDADDINY